MKILGLIALLAVSSTSFAASTLDIECSQYKAILDAVNHFVPLEGSLKAIISTDQFRETQTTASNIYVIQYWYSEGKCLQQSTRVDTDLTSMQSQVVLTRSMELPCQ